MSSLVRPKKTPQIQLPSNFLGIPKKPLWAPAEPKLDVPKCFNGWDTLIGKDKELIVQIILTNKIPEYRNRKRLVDIDLTAGTGIKCTNKTYCNSAQHFIDFIKTVREQIVSLEKDYNTTESGCHARSVVGHFQHINCGSGSGHWTAYHIKEQGVDKRAFIVESVIGIYNKTMKDRENERLKKEKKKKKNEITKAKMAKKNADKKRRLQKKLYQLRRGAKNFRAAGKTRKDKAIEKKRLQIITKGGYAPS